jgi:hypothetical protein
MMNDGALYQIRLTLTNVLKPDNEPDKILNYTGVIFGQPLHKYW